MLHARKILLASAALSTIAACAPKAAAPTDTSADVAALKAMQDRELAVIASGNVDTMLTVFTADVMFMPPGEPAVNGAENGRKWLEALTKDVLLSGKYASADVDVSGDLGVVHYTGELTATPKKGGKPTTELLKGVHIYKRQPDGSWKIAQDVWNTNAPPPPAAK